jgi:hypothetical protein
VLDKTRGLEDMRLTCFQAQRPRIQRSVEPHGSRNLSDPTLLGWLCVEPMYIWSVELPDPIFFGSAVY